MSIKKLLGLTGTNISDCEIIAKLTQAQRRNLDEIEFVKVDGTVIKIQLPISS